MVDASVVVKWLVTEDYSDEAVGPLNGGATLVAPALVFAETVNADVGGIADYREPIGVAGSSTASRSSLSAGGWTRR